MRVFKIFLIGILFLSSVIFDASAQTKRSKKRKPVQKFPRHEWVAGTTGDIYLMDSPGIFSYVRPFVQYRYVNPKLRSWNYEVVTAYVHNRFVANYHLNQQWKLSGRFIAEFSNDGDSPFRDGVKYEQYKFRVDSYRVLGAAEWNSKIWKTPVSFEASVGHKYLQVAKKANQPTFFIDPNDFVESSLGLRFETGHNFPPTELAEIGLRTAVNFAYLNRFHLDAWGPAGKTKAIRNYGKASAGYKWAAVIWLPFVFVTGLQGSTLLGDGDRLNAIRGTNFLQKDESLFTGWIRTTRAVAGDIGVRIYFERKGLIAFRPFGYWAVYREIFADGTERNDLIQGAGFKLMGRVKRWMFMDLTYAIGKGNRDDLSLIQELKYTLVARF